MIDLTVVARQGVWVLEDDDGGELGRYDSQAGALAAAGDFVRVAEEPRVVLICDDAGEWDETVVEPAVLN